MRISLRQGAGFTLIEMIVFIAISGLLMSTILSTMLVTVRSIPTVHQQWVGLQAARQCLEWYVGQRRLVGYSSLTCSSTPSPSLCAGPSGYTVTTAISCTTWNSDNAYKTITVTVTGLASLSLTTQIGDT